MSPKKKGSPVVYQEIEMHTEYSPVLQWHAEMVQFTDEKLDWVISVVAFTPKEVITVLYKAVWLAETGLREGHLLLPDMGDFKIRYPER